MAETTPIPEPSLDDMLEESLHNNMSVHELNMALYGEC